MVWVGRVASLLAGEAGLFLDVAPIRMFFFGIAWWSYILLVDACVWRRLGYPLRNRPKEFWFLAFWSVPLWNLFELLNFRLQNWFYINVPATGPSHSSSTGSRMPLCYRALFETYELLTPTGRKRGQGPPLADHPAAACRVRRPSDWDAGGPLAWPRRWLSADLGFCGLPRGSVLLLGGHPPLSLARTTRTGGSPVFLRLLLAGLICGGLWEFWNFWAYTKWLYTVPHFEDLKWFEMPPLGFVGFPVFALECYVLVNLLTSSAVAGAGRHRSGRSRHAARLAIPAIAVALAFNGFTYAGIEALTVKSVAPTLAEMEEVDGEVGRTGAIRCDTPPTLLRRTATPERFATLARQIQSRRASCRGCAKEPDWSTSGLGATNYNALRRVGITTIVDLAQHVPPLFFQTGKRP